MSARSLAMALVAAAVLAPAPASSQQWTIPPDVLADIDLRSPKLADATDLALQWRAAADLERAAALMGSGRAAEVPGYYRAWARWQLGWWEEVGRWLYGTSAPVYDDGVVFCGGLAAGQVRGLITTAHSQAVDFLRRRFGIPRPKYAVFVRLFGDWSRLPRPVAEAFGRHEGLVSVSGLTLAPRFIIIPTVLPARHFWSRDEKLVGPGGRIASLLTLRDIVYHEMVHGIVLGVMDELSHDRRRYSSDDLPQWLHEGLAVYVTEKLKIEPGTKPVSYYRFAAPLHYLEDEWGAETLRDFVHAAVVESFAAGMAEVPLSEQRLLEKADEHMRRPAPLGTVARGLGYVVAFLLALLALALAPAAVSWAWRAVRAAVVKPDEGELQRLWEEAWWGEGERAAAAARAFCRAYRRARPQAREAFAWRRCKIFLALRE